MKIFSEKDDLSKITGISKQQHKYMRRMRNPILTMIFGSFYKNKFRKLMKFDETVHFFNSFWCNTDNITVGKYSSLADLYIHNKGKIIIGEHVSFAEKTRIICGTHDFSDFRKTTSYVVTIEDEAFIGFGATILLSSTIGRGAYIGTESVVRNNIPPYAIVYGNPAKIVGFRMTPSEIIEYEKERYPEDKRLSIEFLKKNYDRYFLKRITSIKDFVRS